MARDQPLEALGLERSNLRAPHALRQRDSRTSRRRRRTLLFFVNLLGEVVVLANLL